MAPLLNYLLLTAFVLYGLFLLLEVFKNRAFKPFIVQLILLMGLAITLYFAYNFPFPRRSFGSVDSPYVMALMLLFIVLGIASNYLFFNQSFVLRDFLRPILISPILLIPLYTLVSGNPSHESMKVIWLCLLAYQNGFFWKTMFEKIETSQSGKHE